MRRLRLLSHASTAALRRGSFAADEPLDEPGRRQAVALRGRLGRAGDVYASPALQARETAELAGLTPQLTRALADCDLGSWAGSSLTEVGARHPKEIAAWRGDPSAVPHGGESLLALIERVGVWLDEQARGDGEALAVTHAAVIGAAVVHALDAPVMALWRIDVAPASVTELHADRGRWRLVCLSARA